MRYSRATAITMLLAATVTPYVLVPASYVVSVGDSPAAARKIELFGYPTAHFSLAHGRDKSGNPIIPVPYHLGSQWYLLISHSTCVQSITYFRHVDRPGERYGDWADVQHFQSFAVPRPSLHFYLVGLAILLGLGVIAGRLGGLCWLAVAGLLMLTMLFFWALSSAGGGVAILPLCVGGGWTAAFLLGQVVRPFRPSRPMVEEPSSQQGGLS